MRRIKEIRKSQEQLQTGKCKECGTLLPLLQKNKVPGRDAWACLKCGYQNDLQDMGPRTLVKRSSRLLEGLL